MTKYIFVTGGVVSGLGKGITAAALGRLLKARGFKVTAQKLDPYINIDPGIMSPDQHGEVFVTDDGAETDLDLGHYERFIDEDLNQYSSLTTGKVYWNVLNKERAGEYEGETVQVIPHITNEIKKFIYTLGEKTEADIVITEVGGTVGDIEGLPYIEAIRQVSLEIGRENCVFIHVTLVPFIKGSNEYKSKPTQHSVRELQSLGIMPNIIVCRSDDLLDESMVRKIALFCNVKSDCVIQNSTLSVLYEVPLMLEEHRLSDIALRELHLTAPQPDMREWNSMLSRIKARDREITIGIVGEYVKLPDAYLSVAEALNHGGYETGTNVKIRWIEAEEITTECAEEKLACCNGIIVPGGSGKRGFEGKLAATKYAREKGIPFFGLSFGMHVAAIEFARNVIGLSGANSEELEPAASDKLFVPCHIEGLPKGMRLGKFQCILKEKSLIQKIYGLEKTGERHRNRFEFNNAYLGRFAENGMIPSGCSPDGKLIEAFELEGHRFFVCVQFHPEFKSRPNRAHPLFRAFIAEAGIKQG